MRIRTIFEVGVLFLFCSAASKPTPSAAVVVPDTPLLRLDEIGLYDVGVTYRGSSERRFPAGWSGDFDDATGVACRPAGEQGGRRAFLLHCPWRGGTGTASQTFTISLPSTTRARHIVLRGATAIRPDSVGKSDGATFRVIVNGRKLLDENRTDSAWRPFTFDLTALAGTTITVRFETDPGLKDNPSFDFSVWGDREIVLEGFRPARIPHRDPPPLDLTQMLSHRTSVAIPPGGFGGKAIVAMRQGRAEFRYTGRDGEIAYQWVPPAAGDPALLGKLTLRARMNGDRPVTVPVGGGAKVEWGGEEAVPISVAFEKDGPEVTLTRAYRIKAGTVKIRVIATLHDKTLMLAVSSDRPGISQFDAGGFGPVIRRRQVVTPYYSGSVFYLPAENLFVNASLSYQDSGASAHEGTRARYDLLTDGSRNPLSELVFFTAAWHLAEALPTITNPPSPYIKRLGSRIMLDVWGGRYTSIARDLERLADYGIGPSAIIIHDWQRSGYDNALPAHVPAAADKGGDEGMKELVQTATRLGNLISLHENYVDYYPNFEGFDEKDVALDSEGKRQKAWYNPGTKVQSFAVNPNAILPLARTQSPQIHARYGTNSDYLDVHSAVPPWFHVDLRAGEIGSGKFSRVWDVHRELWQYERDTHRGPVFGEGANHWYWSGLLDGVEAQFGVGWPGSAGTTAPLAVDFDLVKIHPLQLNHGMGYYERWWPEAKWGAIPPMVVLDQYRMQEVAYGHMGFLAGSTWNNVPLAWLEHNLLTPVTARYAAAAPKRIEYRVNGRWVDGTAAAKAEDWARVRVTYSNGLTVVANNSPAPLDVGGIRLPRYGWCAKGAGVTAWTALKGGAVCDYAETSETVYANARKAADWNQGGIRQIRPQVASFKQTGPRDFQAVYRWNVNDRLDQDYTCFVHFGRPGAEGWDEGIKFQGDHALVRRTSEWRPGETVVDGPHAIHVPDNLPDGDYQWAIGLFMTDGGARVSIEGETDKLGRVLLGIVKVGQNGRTVTFAPEARKGSDRANLYSVNVNMRGGVVDFGSVRTDGSVKLRRLGGEWVLQTLPRDRAFMVELNEARFGRPSVVMCDGGTARSITPGRLTGKFWRLPLTGAREYRWKTR